MRQTAAQTTRKRRLYYGWIIVLVVGLAEVAANAEFHPTIGTFIKPMTDEFGWSRSEFVGAISVGTILGGLAALVTGPMLDRFGPRWMLFFSFMVIGGLQLFMANVNSLWQFYVVMVLGRLLVQGVTNVAQHVVVAKWFVRQRGRAVGLAALGQRLGNGLIPAFAQLFISTRGWRTAAMSLGFLTWGLTLLPTAVWLRRQPEDLGLLPDGDAADRGSVGKEGQRDRKLRLLTEPEVSFTLPEALRTPTFYFVLAATCGGFMVGAGFNLHAIPFFGERGLSAGKAVLLVTTWSFIGSAWTLISGFLAERIPIRTLMLGLYVTWALAMFIASQVNSLPMGFLFAAVYGVVFGTTATATSLVYANYFGRANLGAIRGFATPFQMGFNALGPLVGGLAFDRTGSYTSVVLAFMAVMLTSAVLILMARPPQLPRPASS